MTVDPATLRPAGPFVWKLPPGWIEKPNPDRMRYATLAAADESEIIISVFPKNAGGSRSDINRWRRLVGLEPIETADDSISREEINGHAVIFVDVSGPKGRLLGAIMPEQNRTWFIKMQGPSETIAAQKEGFLSLIRSFRWR